MFAQRSVTIYCTFTVEGTHNWNGCPHGDVSYLRNEHRHLFNFRVETNVSHEDRDIEFIRWGHVLRAELVHRYWSEAKSLCEFNSNSCEMLASEMTDIVFNLYGRDRIVKVQVDEDGENGSIVTTTPINL